MSISNRSASIQGARSDDLNRLLCDYEGQYDAIMSRPEDEQDDVQLEWLESGIAVIEDELARRWGEDEGPHDDTPSLGDSGQHMGSYAS